MSTRLVLYTSKICPYAQRVNAALEQVNAKVERVEIDLKNKPEYYHKINPVLKVPALVIDTDSSEKSVEEVPKTGVSIPESLVLLETVADLYPDSNLLPKAGPTNSIQRAKIRLFIEAANTAFISSYVDWTFKEGKASNMLTALESLQDHLPEQGFLLGTDDVTIGDLALAPFFYRFKVFAENANVEVVDIEGGKQLLKTLETDSKYAKINTYLNKLINLPSIKSTAPENNAIIEGYTSKIGLLRSSQ